MIDFTQPQIDRFRSHVHVEPNTGCHLWGGLLAPNGYGTFAANYRRFLAHRVAYEIAKGQIPEGLHLDHLCRQRSCVNPDHLEPVTPRENVLRGEGRAARQARMTHCFRGHELTPENIIPRRGRERQRDCRQCAKVTDRARYAKARSERKAT